MNKTLTVAPEVGSEINAYIGNVKLPNLGSFTFTESVETYPEVIGGVDVTFRKGKKIIVGTFVLGGYDRHELLEAVFSSANKHKDVWILPNQTPIYYIEDLPPFDLTLVGVNEKGKTVKLDLYGVQITQETSSSGDDQVGLCFVALAVKDWREVENEENKEMNNECCGGNCHTESNVETFVHPGYWENGTWHPDLYQKQAKTWQEVKEQLQAGAKPPEKPMYTGGDYLAYFDDVPVTNMESFTWSYSAEIVGDYDANPDKPIEDLTDYEKKVKAYYKGRRVIVGSLVLSEYADEPVLGEVFNWERGDELFELDPFDITILGVNKWGQTSKMVLEGVTISQSTGGKSCSDLGSAVGYSFVAERVKPWRKVG